MPRKVVKRQHAKIPSGGRRTGFQKFGSTENS